MTAPREMFLPGNRNEWTSIVRPPDGYRLAGAIGTTYCLDFTALTAVLLASLDQQSDHSNCEDRAQLLQAITRLGERVRVLVHRGQIHAEVRPSNKVFALFDRMVGEVRHENGNFHPKVWILKYSPRHPVDTEEHTSGKPKTSTSDAIYRLLCTSRNLTLTSTWEAVFCIDGRIARTGDDESVDMGRSVAKFFEKAIATGDPMPKPLQILVKELRQVAFSTEGSKAVQSCEFVWQWPGTTGLIRNVNSRGKTALVVSPFVKASFLKFLASDFKKVIVVSRQEELDCLWDKAIERLIPQENFWVVKANDGDEVAGNVPSLELHAKLLLCEYAKHGGSPARTEAWLGSANASGSAWGLPTGGRMNCEAMVRFRPGIRPDKFLDQFAYRQGGTTDQEAELVLNGWIERYQPRVVENLNEEEQADESLEHVAGEVAARQLCARFERSGEQVVLTVDVTDREAWKVLFAKDPGIRFEVCPLAISDLRQFRDLKEIATSGIKFVELSMAQVGAFLLIQLTHLSTQRIKRFAVKAVTEMDEGFWDDRRVAFLRENLDAKDFREFLRSILFGISLRQELVNGKNGDGDPTKRPERQGASLLDDFTVEDILHACTEDGSRIDEIDRLLQTFEGTQHVDASFREFWANFRQAVGR